MRTKMTFQRKDYGRIFVEKQEDIEIVKNIIKEMDEFEFTYLPEDLICVLDENSIYEFVPKENSFLSGDYELGVKTIYTHKFDSLDTNLLTLKCWLNGIKVFCWFGKGYQWEHI